MTLADEAKLRSRRSILAAAAAGAAAAAAATLKPATVDAASTAVMTEVDTDATLATSVTNTTSGGTAFLGFGTNDGTGLEGDSPDGIGVMGYSTNTTDPATNVHQAGIVGVAGNADNRADNFGLTGVYGYADPSPVDNFVGAGVWGDSPDIGVVGTGATGVQGLGIWGVQGYTQEPGGIAVYAQAGDAGARALRVDGRAEFTRSGRLTMASGTSSKKVTLAGCTSSTLIMAVMASNRTGRWVRAVVPTTGSFTIYLNGTLPSNTNIAWIAFTNPANHGG